MPLSSRVILRWSFAALFFWFGSQQLLQPADWIGFLPEFTGYFPIPAEMLVQLNGWLEVVCAFMLLIGVYTRWVAGFLALHLFGIALTAGGAIGVRDAVLGMMGVALAMSPADDWTFDIKQKAQ